MSRVQGPDGVSWPRALAGAFGALLMSCFVVIGICMIMLFLVSHAFAQDSVRTYPARLGEQDRRLVTEQPNYGTPEHVGQYMSSIAIDTVEVVTSTEISCHEQNLYLHYLLADIARYIGQHPETGPIFRMSIEDIHGAWCIE